MPACCAEPSTWPRPGTGRRRTPSTAGNAAGGARSITITTHRRPDNMSYEPVIGLEVHTQLQTESKLFCGCSTQFGAAPNTHTCPVCLGLPGALPVLNRRAVELAVKAALALGCTVHERRSSPARTISTRTCPRATRSPSTIVRSRPRAVLEFEARGDARRVGIIRVHLEEDAGKSLHEGLPDSDRAHRARFQSQRRAADRDRQPIPTCAIAADAAECFSQAARDPRCDRRHRRQHGGGQPALRRQRLGAPRRGAGASATKTEIKNLNSFRHCSARSNTRSIGRSTCSKAAAGSSTRRGCGIRRRARTLSMRSKEEAHDYRYFPEPDLPPLQIETALDRQRRGGAARTAGCAAAPVHRAVRAVRRTMRRC